jgi:hypothetical protein
MQKLLQAGVEKDESDKEVRLKETVANLQRMFPGSFFGIEAFAITSSLYLLCRGSWTDCRFVQAYTKEV